MKKLVVIEDHLSIMLLGDMNRGCPAGCFNYLNECLTFNFSPSPTDVSVLKIGYLLYKLLNNGKSEQVRC